MGGIQTPDEPRLKTLRRLRLMEAAPKMSEAEGVVGGLGRGGLVEADGLENFEAGER